MPSLTPPWSRYKDGALLLTLNTWKKNSFRVNSCLFPPYKSSTVVNEYFKSISKWNIIFKKTAWDKRRTRILITNSGAPGLSNIPADICPSCCFIYFNYAADKFKAPNLTFGDGSLWRLEGPVQYLRCSTRVNKQPPANNNIYLNYPPVHYPKDKFQKKYKRDQEEMWWSISGITRKMGSLHVEQCIVEGDRDLTAGSPHVHRHPFPFCQLPHSWFIGDSRRPPGSTDYFSLDKGL